MEILGASWVYRGLYGVRCHHFVPCGTEAARTTEAVVEAMDMMYIGIGIGRTGAIAFLSESGEFRTVHDLPIETYQNGKGTKVRWRLDAAKFWDMCCGWAIADYILVEDVWTRPTDTGLTAIGLGRLLGGIEATIHIVCFKNPHIVSPQKWKRHFGLIKQDKGASLALARQFFPDAPLTHKKDHNRAEALLIARYAYETREARNVKETQTVVTKKGMMLL